MPNELPYLAIDFDNHYYEQDDCFSRHIEPQFRDDAIHPVALPDGSRPWVMRDRLVKYFAANAGDAIPRPGFMEHNLTDGSVQEWTDDVMISAWDHPEMVHRGQRLSTLDRHGLEAAVLIPTAGLGIEWSFQHELPALCANLRSFNRWVEEEWGFGGDGRIFGVPMVTLLDLDWAIEELERVAELGSRMVFVKVGPVAGRSPADPEFDRWWARVEEMGVRPVLHIGDSGFPEMYASHWGEDPDRGVDAYSAFQHYLCVGERPVEDTMAALVLHNLFGRFPGVEVISLENGSSWVAPLAKGLDKAANLGANGPWLGGPLADRPSDIFKEHVYVAPYFEDDITQLAEVIGADHVLFGSDWPHPEGVAEPLGFLNYLEGFPADDVHRIMRGNGARLLGLAA